MLQDGPRPPPYVRFLFEREDSGTVSADMACPLSLLQSLLGVRVPVCDLPNMRLYQHAFTAMHGPAFPKTVDDEAFLRLLPSPGSLQISRTPSMRMAALFERLGELRFVLPV
jgi:hypothetical protein